MARAIWSGAISFGLVNVPVQMYSAIAEHKLHFRLVHERDESPIGYQKVCKLEDKPVPDDEVVKAFDVPFEDPSPGRRPTVRSGARPPRSRAHDCGVAVVRV